MSGSFTQIFGGTTIYPADVSYLALALVADVSLVWPVGAPEGSAVVASIIDITPTGSYTITMPDATEVSVGQTVLFNNIGPSTVFVDKADGNAILSIATGEQWQAYLIDNTTVGGTWRTLRYGASVAQAQAAALAGPGLVTDGSQLAQNYEVIDFSITPYALTSPDRAKVFVWTGGLGQLDLPPAALAGDGWFVQVRNAGQGDLSIEPSGSELINAGLTISLQPADSAVIVSDGAQWYTIGLGQQAVFAFDYTTIAVTGGTYTLSGSELNRIAYKFTGTLVSNVTIVVPATVQQYWVNNATTGAFTLSLRAAGSGVSTLVTQASTSILYCDGTTIIPATTAVTFAGILPVTQGGTGANNPTSARTNLGATGIGNALFTALTDTSARATISAAKSGANSDITSLSGLTTPLSVPQGGSGVATLTANGVVLGNGASALSATAVGTTGQVLVGNTGAAPSWATLTGIGVTSFSAGTTGLTPSTATTGAITLAGTLGVANGGTGTATAFTAGSVAFAGASGVYSQDNANFFWDDSTNRLGLGTNAPIDKLSIVDETNSGFRLAEYNDTDGAALRLLAARGTIASPTALTADSVIFGLRGIGYTSAGSFSSAATAAINARAAENFTATAQGTYLQFSNAATGTTTLVERMRITSAGDVGIGTSAPTGKLDVNGKVVLTGGEDQQIQWTNNSQTWRLNNSVTGRFYLYDVTGNKYPFGVAANTPSDTLILNSTGVGVGTTTPGSKFEVLGGTVGTTAGNEILIANQRAIAGTNSVQLLSRLIRASNGADWTTTTMRLQGRVDTSNFGYIDFVSGGGQGLVFGSDASERMRIDGSGNVGIGTSSPSSGLDVNGFVWCGTKTAVSGAGGNVRYRDDTGTFRYAAGILGTAGATAFSIYDNIAATERMVISSTGNVGIGTSSPGKRLEVRGIGSNATIRLKEDGTYGVAWDIDVGSTNQMLFTNNAGSMLSYAFINGNVGIGVTSPTAKLDVLGDLVARTNASGGNTPLIAKNDNTASNTTKTTGIQFQGVDTVSVTKSVGYIQCGPVDVNYVGSYLAFQTRLADTTSEKMRLTAEGYLLIGSTSTSYAHSATSMRWLSSSGGLLLSQNTTANVNQMVFFNPNGAVGSINTDGSSTIFATSSDVRLKDNIADADDAASLIDAIQVRKFDWKADGSHQRYGFVAQELVTVAPEAVNQPADPDAMMGVDYSKLVPMLVKEIQSLRARVAQLEGN